jgi:PadR family transcriptional regulator, regulatory protein PadR
MSTFDIGRGKEVLKMQISSKALQVLMLFVNSSSDPEISGAQVSKAIGIGSGTLYPLLMRFETNGWMESRWEEVDPSLVGRPRRRLYSLTPQGRQQAIREIGNVQTAGHIEAAHSLSGRGLAT